MISQKIKMAVTARMLRKLATVVYCALMFTPLAALSGELEYAALKEYFYALSKGDLEQIGKILSPDYEYRFYKNNKLQVLNREKELKSLGELFRDARNQGEKGFVSPERLERIGNSFHIEFKIVFQDNPKEPSKSFFRGAVLDIDEKLTVTLNKNKISRIAETKDKRGAKLSFGYLKAIHVKDFRVKV